MKIALLISGYLRSYENNLDFVKNKILERYKNVDVYLHITNNENTEDKYLNLICDDDIKNVINCLKPVSILIENNTHFSENVSVNNIINNWEKLFKLNNLKKINEETSKFRYDLVIRYRLDLCISEEYDNLFEFIDDSISIPNDSKIDKKLLKYPTDGYLCCGLAFGKSEIMDDYFNIYNHLNYLIYNYGTVPETLLYNYLNENSINYKLVELNYSFILSKCNVFGICGDSGSGKTTLSSLLKKSFSNSFMLEGDRYHKWERKSENWKMHTHLNPDANFITKLNEDVFNLKIGNSIYQVDYDHSNGKFTEKQLINPSENLIVCGLHSLYGDNSNLYNIKIFMDTEESLKTKWKLVRDVSERGAEKQIVLDTIKKRKPDYVKYVDPQKYNSDVIVKFFGLEDINFEDLNHVDEIGLELSIIKKINISNILDILKSNDITFSVEYDNSNFLKIRFVHYKDSVIFHGNNFPKTNSYYDYVLFFILNLRTK